MKIFLHGNLGHKFGREWDLKINTAAEAFKAIDANSDGFYKHILDGQKHNIRYAAIQGDKQLRLEDQLHFNLKEEKDLHILAVPEGALDEDDLMWWGFGGALLGAGLSTWAENWDDGWLKTGAIAIGSVAFDLGMALGTTGLMMKLMDAPSVTAPDIEMTAPPEEKAPEKKNTTSFTFSRPVNNTSQGVPVPIGYGRLRVGSSVISSALLNCRITPFPSIVESNEADDGNLQVAATVDQFSSTASAGALAPLNQFEMERIVNSETADGDSIVELQDSEGDWHETSMALIKEQLGGAGAWNDFVFTRGLGVF